jgi:hypothetical protein
MICSAFRPGCCLLPVGILLVLGSALTASAQPTMPPPPREYQVTVRYHVFAAPGDRVHLFRQLVNYLESVGFQKNPGPRGEAELSSYTRMTGTIRVHSWRERGEIITKLLADPHVQELQLIPTGFNVPANPGGRVQVGLNLVTGYSLMRQRLLFDQVKGHLEQVGFIEAVGYDNYGHSRLVGSVPVTELSTLLQDIRYVPSGWLVPMTALSTLPTPLRDGSPVLVSEVLRQPPAQPVPAWFTPPGGQEYLLKLSPTVRRLALGQGQASAERLDVILSFVPRVGDRQWRQTFHRVAPGTLIDGRLGELVVVRTSLKNAIALARLPFVSAVRLPRPAASPVHPVKTSANETHAALRESGLAELHRYGRRGRGVRVAIVDSDFRGYEKFIGKKLPHNLHYLDLTAARNPDLRPDPFSSPAGSVGAGTQRALAATLAAPDADLTLIRIDPAAPYQVETIARAINGEEIVPESFQSRIDEFDVQRRELEQRRSQLDKERKVILKFFPDVKERTNLENKPPDTLRPEEQQRLKEIQRYDQYFKDLARLDREEQAHDARVARYAILNNAVKALRGMAVVSSSLVWEDGYPLGGDSALSRYFDEHPFHAAVWLQSAGTARDQSWAGLYRDDDGNGVLEFASVPLDRSADWWKAELNFLAWKPAGKPRQADLPAGVPLRLSLQWREAHDPSYAQIPGDPYLQPLAKLRILVLHQLDPTGTKLPSDAFEVVAASEIPAGRLDNFPSSATYEQTVTFTLKQAGRYAVRIEGRVPDDIRPQDAPVLPGQKVGWELRPRLFVDVVGGHAKAQGRPILGDFAARVGSIGVPGDARSILTVSAAALTGHPEPYATAGPPYDLRLLAKPDLLAFDTVSTTASQEGRAYDTDLATSFAAGMAATAMSAGMPKPAIYDAVRSHPGKVWRLR